MRVSTRGRYGLRAMLDLARHFGDAPVLTRTLAERQGLSRKYLHALLTVLKSAGLVRSMRGPGGGFALSRPPGEIRLGEVLRVVEGPLSLVECVADRGACDRIAGCEARQVWMGLSEAIEKAVDSVTLEDLVTPGVNVRLRLDGREDWRAPDRSSRKPKGKISAKSGRAGAR